MRMTAGSSGRREPQDRSWYQWRPSFADTLRVGSNVVDSPAAQFRIGTFYLLPVDETLFVAQAFERDVAMEALAALP
jgi:hypothetical protein